MQWFIVDEVPDAAIGYRAIVEDDGTTVCNPSPMGARNAAIIAKAPDMLALLQLAAATSTDPLTRSLAQDMVNDVELTAQWQGAPSEDADYVA